MGREEQRTGSGRRRTTVLTLISCGRAGLGRPGPATPFHCRAERGLPLRAITCDTVTAQIQHAIADDDMPELDRLLTVLDQLDVPKPAVALLSAALWYGTIGLPVFPLQPGSKIPHRGTRGLNDATTDPDLIRAAWAAQPDSNIGIATGHFIDVIDIDGPVGVKTWAWLIEEEALPPVLGIVSTPRPGGNHLYVAASGRGNKAAIWPGIDYRGVGGYAVGPPSVNAQGIRYRWASPLRLDRGRSDAR